MVCFYGSERQEMTLSEPDSRSLAEENKKLRLKLAQLAKSQGSPVRGPKAAKFSLDVDDDSFEEALGDSEEEEMDDAIGNLLQVSLAPKAKVASGKSRKKGLPSTGAAGAASTTAQGSKSGPDDLLSDASLVQSQVMLEILRELKGMRSGGDHAASGDAPDGKDGFDGVRVLRTLGRMRALKQQLTEQPEQIIAQYIQRWEDDLGAQGKPWRWLDTNRHIHWAMVM